MCALPPPQDPSHWPARVGHLQASLEASLAMLRMGRIPAAEHILWEALRIEQDADLNFHAYLTEALRKNP